jgi:hypothetical protein
MDLFVCYDVSIEKRQKRLCKPVAMRYGLFLCLKGVER